MPITAFYASLLVPLFVLISIRVIRARRSQKVALGDGGNPLLLRYMRVQANFAEYVPLTLVLFALAESLRTAPWLLHLMGLSLLIGRVLHMIGVSQANEKFVFRVTGMAMTFTVMLIAALTCLAGALWQGFALI